MKALFNGTCHYCRDFKPRCATVYMRMERRINRYCNDKPLVLCEECRKVFRYRYRLGAKHKGG